MRMIVLAAAACVALAFALAEARAEGAWCILDSDGCTNCAFQTRAQCVASATGTGGSCVRNVNLFGIRRRPGAQAHQLAALPRSGSHSNVKSENGMVWPCSSPASEPNWQGGIKLFAMPIDRVSDAPFSTSRRDGVIALSRSSPGTLAVTSAR